MNPHDTLTHEQFDRVARAFQTIIERDLQGDEARAWIREQSADDPVIASRLLDMLAAHTGEDGVTDDDRFHAAALEAVRAEAAAADEHIDQVIPASIGPYRVIRFVASGGMSTVYEAEQEEPRRRVAIKVIRLELLTKESIRRFEAEGHLLAGLRHEGIARVYAMGRTETPAGQVPYLVLEFVDGMSITEYAEAKALGVRERIALLRRVCAAVQYAHDNGVLHRDLKPGNILVDADGNPRILDFGIARPFDETWSYAARSASGLFLGTLAYMSPEQAMQTGTPPDVRVDVYGVGAVGYELLAGRPPHEIGGLPLHEAVKRVVHHAPSSLAARHATYTGDLSAVFSKALATDRERRYSSVRQLDEDLRRYLEHEPVEARPPSALYQVRMLIRRNRTTFALLGLLLVSLIAGLTIALAQRRTAVDARAAAERTAREATRDRQAAELHAAWSALETGRIKDASELLDRTGGDATGIEWDLLRARAYGAAAIRELDGLGRDVVHFAADGGSAITRDREGVIVRVDMGMGTPRPLVSAEGGGPGSTVPRGAAYAFAAKTPGYAVLHTPDRLTIVDAERGTVVRTVEATAPVVGAVDPDDDLFVWPAGPQRIPRLVDLVRGEIVHDPRIATHTAGMRLSTVLHGRFLLADGEHRIAVVDLTDLSVTRIERVDLQAAAWPVMDKSGRYLLLPYQYPEVHELETGEVWNVGAEASSYVLDGAFSAAGTRLALLHANGEVRIWDVPSKRLVHTATDGRITIRRRPTGLSRRRSGAIAFDARSGAIHTIGGGYAVDWPTQAVSTRLNHGFGRKPYPYVYDLDWHPEGRWLASVAWDERIVIWDTWTGEALGAFDLRAALAQAPPERQPEDKRLSPNAVMWSADGQHLAVQCASGWSAVWDVWSKQLSFTGPLEGALLRLEAGGDVVLAGADGAATRVTLEQARRAHTTYMKPSFRSESPPPWALDRSLGPWPTTAWGFTWSGSKVAAGRHPVTGMAGAFRVWDTDAPDRIWEGLSSGDVLCAQLADAGRRLLLGMRAGTIQVFDTERRKRMMVIQAHRHYIMALALSPDGKTLASGSGDGWIRLWPLTPAAERSQRARLAAAQRRRLAPLVERHRRTSDSLAEALEALLRDDAIAPEDRSAAKALLLRASR
ncbi:MAG: serine/threonine-protein kinase [Planctomycetota bacterium]|nr:serine/threonine-protein kinase [Planctomycetota bacterium]